MIRIPQVRADPMIPAGPIVRRKATASPDDLPAFRPRRKEAADKSRGGYPCSGDRSRGDAPRGAGRDDRFLNVGANGRTGTVREPIVRERHECALEHQTRRDGDSPTVIVPAAVRTGSVRAARRPDSARRGDETVHAEIRIDRPTAIVRGVTVIARRTVIARPMGIASPPTISVTTRRWRRTSGPVVCGTTTGPPTVIGRDETTIGRVETTTAASRCRTALVR